MEVKVKLLNDKTIYIYFYSRSKLLTFTMDAPTFTKIISPKNVSYCYKNFFEITWIDNCLIKLQFMCFPFFPDKIQKEKVKEENLQFKMYLSWL